MKTDNLMITVDGALALMQLMANRNIAMQDLIDELSRMESEGKENFDIAELESKVAELGERVDNF